MFTQISDNRVFEDEDEERFDQLISDMTAWMNKYASLYDDPDTILDDLEVPEMAEVEEIEQDSPIVQSTTTPEPQDQDSLQYTSEILIEYQYPGMQLDTSSFFVSYTFYD